MNKNRFHRYVGAGIDLKNDHGWRIRYKDETPLTPENKPKDPQ